MTEARISRRGEDATVAEQGEAFGKETLEYDPHVRSDVAHVGRLRTRGGSKQ